MDGCHFHHLWKNASEVDGDANSTADDPSEHLAVRITVPITFFIIFVVGLVGNGTLIYTIFANESMHTKPNVMIVSLAIGDFLLILFSVPFTSTIYTFDEWIYGSIICKLNEFMQTLSLGVSVFTLSALSVDRYIAVVHPFTAYCAITVTKVRVAAVAIWVVAVLMAVMDFIAADVRPCITCSNNISICNLYPVEWGNEYANFRLLFRLVVYFLLPVVIIATLYAIIVSILLHNAKAHDAQGYAGGASASAVNRRYESRKRMAKVVLSFVVIFIVCWLPRNFYVFWFYYVDFPYNTCWHAFKIVAFCLCFIYSAVNPLALYFLNDDFRQYFRYYLFRHCNSRWGRLPTDRQTSVQSTIVRYSVV